MSTDRELLELAAKAIHLPENYENAAFMRGFYSNWNPLTDDGDALRLAEKLSIGLQWCASGRVYAYGDGGEVAESSREDRQSNLRRAIVRAAAEIGRSMP